MKQIGIAQDFFKSLNHNEALMKILNTIQEGVQIVDAEGIVVYMNQAALDIVKVSKEQRLGKNIHEISPGAALELVLNTRKPVSGNYNITPENKIEIFANASPIFLNGQFIGAIVIFRDITNLRNLLKELEDTKAALRDIHNEFSALTSAKYSFDDMVGKSKRLEQCISYARKASRSDAPVLITGESGTGKEVLAHAIHKSSDRTKGPFIKINCAAIPNSLIESELFGYAKGAFTGALKSKIGKFELANGGTFFLDEIGDMDLSMQSKLLRVLQDKEIVRLGENDGRKVDVRIIAATNKNIKDEIEKGKFREELYFRLEVVNIELPPLRHRKEDIPELSSKIIQKLNKKYHSNAGIDHNMAERLQQHIWPGNIRELENVLERYVILSGDDSDVADRLISQSSLNMKSNEEELIPIKEVERKMIQLGLKRYGGNLKGKQMIAKKMDMGLSTLYKRIKEYKLEDLIEN